MSRRNQRERVEFDLLGSSEYDPGHPGSNLLTGRETQIERCMVSCNCAAALCVQASVQPRDGRTALT